MEHFQGEQHSLMYAGAGMATLTMPSPVPAASKKAVAAAVEELRIEELEDNEEEVKRHSVGPLELDEEEAKD